MSHTAIFRRPLALLAFMMLFASAIPGQEPPQAGRGYATNRPAANIPPPIPPSLLSSTDQAIEQQSRGDFPVMDRAPSLPLGSLQRSWDRPAPASGQSAPGIVHYFWQADFVMAVRTRDFMVTTLMLPVWEHVTDFYLGDPVIFEAKRVKPNVMAVRSRSAGADSNLTLLGGSGNLYNFYLRSEAWNSAQLTDLAVYVDAAAPNDDDMASEERAAASGSAPGPAMPDYVRRIMRRPEDVRFDMKIYANRPEDAAIAPERVFEDGLFTYFDFGAKADTVARPVVHQLIDGVDSVVNSRTTGPNGSILVAEAVGDFTLRNGGRVVCVKHVPGAAVDRN